MNDHTTNLRRTRTPAALDCCRHVGDYHRGYLADCGVRVMAVCNDIPVDLFLVVTGEMRAVRSAKRKRKLNNRGDLCRWSTYLNCWLWKPPRNYRRKLIIGSNYFTTRQNRNM